MVDPDPALAALLQATVSAGASDLHLSVGRPATARRDGYLVKFEGVPVLEPADTERIVMSLLDERLAAELREEAAILAHTNAIRKRQADMAGQFRQDATTLFK